MIMTATLQEIHLDPLILDRAIARAEPLDILDAGHVTATLLPQPGGNQAAARQRMRERFDRPDWNFSVGPPMTRAERNTRG